VDVLLAEHAWLFRLLIPGADVQHVGSTALPDFLTKGDLDIQIRVSAASLEEGKARLLQRYALLRGGFAEVDGISLHGERASTSIGIHLTVVSGSCDFQWKHREALAARPDLRAEYESLKRQFHGKSMQGYREAKGRFWGRVMRTAEYQKVDEAASLAGFGLF
jgi:GrpB-like predicted nucleotidyltransferase (UPF0157 family)